jgi:hypothetical protein
MKTGENLAARYCLKPNLLQYCGPNSAQKTLLEHVKKGGREKEVRELVMQFEVPPSYLRLISKRHSLDPFSKEVVEAYWIGNRLLEGFKKGDFVKIIDDMEKEGLPDRFSKPLKEEVRDGFLPHHSFHVLFVGVGRTTGSVSYNLSSINNCLILPAVIEGVEGDMFSVKKDEVVEKKGKLAYKKFSKSLEVKDGLGFLNKKKKGDVISLHWGMPCDNLGKREMENLRRCTKKNIEMMNSLKG